MEEKTDGVIEVGTHGHPIIRDIKLAATGEIVRISVEEPEHQRVLASGAILDTVTGAFVKGAPKGGAWAITKDNQGEVKGEFFQRRAQEIVRGPWRITPSMSTGRAVPIVSLGGSSRLPWTAGTGTA